MTGVLTELFSTPQDSVRLGLADRGDCGETDEQKGDEWELIGRHTSQAVGVRPSTVHLERFSSALRTVLFRTVLLRCPSVGFSWICGEIRTAVFLNDLAETF